MKHLLLTTIAAVVLVGCGSPMWVAARKGNIKAVKQHLAAGALVNAKNESGWTPLHQAAWGGHTEVAELLIAKGAEVNAMGYEYGATPLDLAGLNDYVETKKLLVKHGGKSKKELVGHKWTKPTRSIT